MSEQPAPATTGSAPGRTLPRSAVVAALAIVAGAAVVLLASSPTWLRVSIKASRADVRLTGHNVAGSAVPLALVAAAGVIAVALVRNWARRVLGALIAAAGVGVLIAAIRVVADPHRIARTSSKVRSVGAFGGVHLGAPPFLCIVGALLVIAGGLVAVVYAGRWPAPATRYERAQARAARPADDWEALDRGEDPTLG